MASGLDKIPLRIPDQWDPAWFENFIQEVLRQADVRNAIQGPGILIEGESDVPATISASDDLQNLLNQSFILAVSSAFLTNERRLQAEAGVLEAVDGGPNADFTIKVKTNGIGNAKFRLAQNLSVVGRPVDSIGNISDILSSTNDTVLRRVTDTLGFGQLTVDMAPDALWPYAKIQDVSTDSVLLGRGDSSAGEIEEITLGSNLTMSGTTLNASGGGGGGGFEDFTKVVRIAQADGTNSPFNGSFAGAGLPLGEIAPFTSGAVTPSGSTSLFTSMIRRRMVTNTFTDQSCGVRPVFSDGPVFVATSGAATGGGFEAFYRFGFDTMRSDQRFYVGVFPVGTASPTQSSNPSALTNVILFAKDDTDTNMQFMHNDGSGTATKVDLGVAATTLAGKIIELRLTVPPGGGSCSYDVRVLDGSSPITGSVSTNLPATDTSLYVIAFANTGGSTSTAVSIDVNRIVISTDV